MYDWPRVFGLVRRLQPEAVIFSDAGPDVRWCGNERGVAGDPNWSTVDPKVVSFPGQSGSGVEAALQHGHKNGSVWRPAEVDVSIRPGWFYHPAQDARVRTVDNLVELYFTSVGRNSKLLLNVPPTRDGLIHDVDAARLAGFRARRNELFGAPVKMRRPAFRPQQGGARIEWELERPARPRIARLAEDITRGQRVASYRLEGLQGGSVAGACLRKHHRIREARPAGEGPPLRRVRVVIVESIDRSGARDPAAVRGRRSRSIRARPAGAAEAALQTARPPAGKAPRHSPRRPLRPTFRRPTDWCSAAQGGRRNSYASSAEDPERRHAALVTRWVYPGHDSREHLLPFWRPPPVL